MRSKPSKQHLKAVEKAAIPIASKALPNLWSKDSLLLKAQRYSEEMHGHESDDWRFGFWSTLMLELLSRAALANISPVLLADTRDRDSWNNLYYSLGHAPKVTKFIPKSIDISAVFMRLTDIIPEFDARLAGFCAIHIAHRNEELHSGGLPFDAAASADWQPIFYETCDVLVRSMGVKLSDLLGVGRAKMVLKMVDAAKDKSAQAVAKDVQAHKLVWDSKTVGDRKKFSAQASLWATKQLGHRVKCPSCGCDSLVKGSPIAPSVAKLKNDKIVVTQESLPSKFECVACGLKISGLPHLHACSLGNPYKATYTYDPIEYYVEHGSYDYEPDNND